MPPGDRLPDACLVGDRPDISLDGSRFPSASNGIQTVAVLGAFGQGDFRLPDRPLWLDPAGALDLLAASTVRSEAFLPALPSGMAGAVV